MSLYCRPSDLLLCYHRHQSIYYQEKQKHPARPGLTPLLTPLYNHLTIVRAQYSTTPNLTPYLDALTQRLKRDLTTRRVTDDPWDLARKVGVFVCVCLRLGAYYFS